VSRAADVFGLDVDNHNNDYCEHETAEDNQGVLLSAISALEAGVLPAEVEQFVDAEYACDELKYVLGECGTGGVCLIQKVGVALNPVGKYAVQHDGQRNQVVTLVVD